MEMDRPANPSPSTASTVAQPTTYVHADAATFRELVQRLTGASPSDTPDKLLPVTARPAPGPRRPGFKLQERRGPSVRNLEIQLGLTSLRSPRSPRSPSLVHHHHHLVSSPVTPLGSDPLFSPAAASEEERAIAEKGFYLHPSPRGAACEPPELLPLFPLSSPKQQQGNGEKRERP